MLKTVNEGFNLAAEELRLEKIKQAQDEQDKENEIIPQSGNSKSSRLLATCVLGLIIPPLLALF